jgi:hypothetical protein
MSCAACAAGRHHEQLASETATANAWLVGFACGVRAGIKGTPVDMCAEHANAYAAIRIAMGDGMPLIEALPGNEPPDTLPCATLAVFVTQAEFEAIRSIAISTQSENAIEKAVRQVLGDDVWARFKGEVTVFVPCTTVPAERFVRPVKKPS